MIQSRLPNRLMAATLLIASATLAGCGPSSKGGGRVESAGAQPAASGWEGREKVGDAIALLNAGEAEKARKLLAKVVARQPGDAVAASLLRQIDTPAETLLGSQSYTVTARSGDSFSSLAQRHLGDPMMFYALARYNGLQAAGTVTTGQKIRVPGREPQRATPRPDRTPAEAKAAPRPAPVVAAPRPAPAANPAGAQRLRAAALEQMNRGQIDRAVGLLNQATRLDPANPLVRRDLERALRIRRTVRAKS
ncbi:LysM domain-containing protein [Sphingomonas sp. 1P06PA]|uniref:LysM peptidoglycan-binding domain-containing protein n=1 Tax=Sphingomonas sp. 1P06PA TaxID=554121 RepID=UPI0039A74ED2